MNAENDDRKPRSRESKYYHDRKARGDHLFRLWADADTTARFRRLLERTLILQVSSEDIFREMVEREYARRYGE